MLLTNLIFEPRGKHDPALAYSIKDTVMSADGSRVYFALQDVPAGIALSDEEYWKLQIDLSASKTSMDNAIADFANYAKMVGTKVRGETAKVSGNPVTFLPDTGSLLQPVTVLEPQQEGSGDPSPENIRPFIGYDKLDLNHAGKNLFDADCVPPTQTRGGVTLSNNGDGTLTFSGTATEASSWSFVLKTPIPAGTYTLSANNANTGRGSSFKIYFADSNNVDAAGASLIDAAYSTRVFSVGSPITLFKVFFGAGTVTDGVTIKPQLELGSTATSFIPYTGTLHTVQIGQTVYGIRYEWLTGKAWIEWIVKNIVSAADIVSSYKNIDGTALICVIATDAIAYAADVLSDVLSSHFAAVTSNDQYLANGNSVSSSGGNVAITVKDVNAIEDMDVFLAAQYAAGTPVQVCWKLAQPIEIQLTPHVISAVEPEQNNTLYGDGTIEVEYVKPLHVSIEERVAAALAAAAE